MEPPKRGNDKEPEKGAPAKPAPPRRGTASLDSFQSGTGMLGGTRRMGTGTLNPERMLATMAQEVENGKIVIGKLEGRMAVLLRATQIMEYPAELNQIIAGISAGEANFTKQVAQVLQREPAMLRRVQVAMYQYEQARTGLEHAIGVVEKAALYQGEHRVQYIESQCHVEKLRGQLYPLINLHVVFKDNTLLSQLIPAPRATPVVDEPPPPPPLPEPGEVKSPSGALPSNDVAVQQVVDAFSRVTGSLRERFTGMLGGKKPGGEQPKK